VGPPFSIAKLVNITPITMVYDTQITIVNGIYKPTNITGGPHIVGFFWIQIEVARYINPGNQLPRNCETICSMLVSPPCAAKKTPGAPWLSHGKRGSNLDTLKHRVASGND
jgi:hypothetical protein